jgi:hypothetical protein
MNHPITSSPAHPRPNARVATWWQCTARWLMRVWAAACRRAESKERFVPYY